MPNQSIPDPHFSFRGPAQKNPGNLDEMAAKWAIPGMLLEPTATVSLYAGRLIDRETGKAYSADELLAGGSVTAASINAALEGETLEVDSMIVADSSTVALAAGVIGWNATLNAFIEHDGITIGGNQIIPNDPLHARGSRVILGSEVTADAQFELHRFPIKSADAVVGQRFKLSGTYYFAANGTRPTSVYFGIIPEDSEAAGVGIVYGADHSGSTLKIVKASVYWEFQLDDGGGGTFTIGPYASNSAETRLTGTTTSEALVTEAYTASSEAGTTGAAQDLVLQIQTSATASAAPCFVVWDLKLEATN